MSNCQLCPKYEKAFELLGKRWIGLIIKALMNGPKRFSDVSSIIPQLSDRVLAERFKELETEGIIERKVYPETPVRIEYQLSEKGVALKRVLEEVQKWADTWINIEEKELQK
ncbi:MAG: winged helix-turn-helix transcriptional regulator [Bacillota bacterium]|nr:winged helix-turn-helix transcriptional regulator [Bacillota bacterium]